MIKDTHQAWFKDAKYGLFIHWGLYAVLAGEYNGQKTPNIGEWIMNHLDIPVHEYEKLARQFNPKHFDADALIKRAKEEWGMRYLVFTAKHHDGFAMYHSKCNPYNVVDATPFGRDVTKELQLACEKYGMKFCLYYSQAQDWHDPDGYAAFKDNGGKNFRAYLERVCKPQLKELLTGYGELGLIWFDTPLEMTEQESRELFDFVKSYQPNCIVSGRIGNNLGEYMTTGDNFIPLLPYQGDWEVPATLNETWGFRKDDVSWKSPDEVIRKLIKINGRGGNYLLNVGPDADGNVPEGCGQVLDSVGDWLKANGEAIYKTRCLPLYPYDLEWALFTGRGNKFYIHIVEPAPRAIIYNIHSKIRSAKLLGSGEPVKFRMGENCEHESQWEFYLPAHLREAVNICIAVETEEAQVEFEPLHGWA